MTDVRTVSDDVLLLGLDSLFREGMKEVESGVLLRCAEAVAAELSVTPKDCAVEGYYHETPRLSRYFKLIRGLQDLAPEDASLVHSQECYQRLVSVCGSSVFGDCPSEGFLPRSTDVLKRALEVTGPDWNMHRVLGETRRLSDAMDHSLVGMACRFGSPFVVAALRETVALYTATATAVGCAQPEYRWEVSDELERLANEFVSHVEGDIGFELPKPSSDNAAIYYHSGNEADILGRCIAIGYNDTVVPVTYYHWGIRMMDGEVQIEEFWDTEMWTTERYSSDVSRVFCKSVDSSRPMCKREGCQAHSIEFSVFCKKHHEEMLHG